MRLRHLASSRSLLKRLSVASLTAAAFVLPGMLPAQVVAGRVTDATGKPVEGAQVQVANASNGLARATVTNSDGRYTVLGLEVGDGYAVTAKRIGYQPLTKSSQEGRDGQ